MTALIDYLAVLLEYHNFLQTTCQSTASICVGLGTAIHAFGCTTV